MVNGWKLPHGLLVYIVVLMFSIGFIARFLWHGCVDVQTYKEVFFFILGAAVAIKTGKTNHIPTPK